jgi:protein TonB
MAIAADLHAPIGTGMDDYEQQQGHPTRHIVGLGVVVLAHVIVVYALVTGLARKMIDVVRQPIETKIVEEVRPPPPPEVPPPPPPKLVVPPAFVPPPEVQIAQPPPPQQAVIAAVTNVAPPEAPPPVRQPEAAPAPAHEPVHVPAVVDAQRSCRQPEYPAASRRLQETGTVLLRFLVGVDGTVVESQIESSSGHDRLDQAAKEALSRCQFKPGTVDGKPEQSWASLKYKWKLQ